MSNCPAVATQRAVSPGSGRSLAPWGRQLGNPLSGNYTGLEGD